MEKGRHGPTKDILTDVEAAYPTVRILAFQGTEAAEDVRARASALVENLREMQETCGAVPRAPAEQMEDKPVHALSRAEAVKQQHQQAGAEAYTEWEFRAKADYEMLRGALDCLDESHAEQEAAYADGAGPRQ